MYKMIYNLACIAYKMMIRDMIKKAIDDPNSDIDELALEILDRVFNYKEE